MTSTRATEDRQPSQADRRRKRNRATAAPSPKNIVSGAGQPLDVSVRREVEERLGYDFGQVRLHTDRDADALATLVGADAVTVGTDVFFRAGAYQPDGVDGQRLLVHELLHTVQDPHGLGVLRVGRGDGAVSLPADPAERAAEEGASHPEGAADVEPEAPLPGWMRFATVTADRMRVERLDPATLPDRLTASIVRSLRGDPADWSRRTRVQLSRLPSELVEPVLERLENRLLGPEYERVLDLLGEVEGEVPEPEAHAAPLPEPDVAEWLRNERELARRRAAEERARAQRPAPAPGPELEGHGDSGAAGSTPRNGGERGDQVTPQTGAQVPGPAAARPPAATAAPGSTASSSPGSAAASGPASTAAPTAASAPGSSVPAASATSDSSAAATQGAGGGSKSAAPEQPAKQEVPVASPEASAAKNRPEAADTEVAGVRLKPEDKLEPGRPAGSPVTSGKDTQLFSAAATLDPVRNQDVPELAEPAADPSPPTSVSEVDPGGEPESAWDITLRPEDFLPAQDPDVSAIPTVDMIDPESKAVPPMPSFPAPPVTRADRVQAERDAEDEAAEAEEAEEEPVEPESSLPETEAAAESPAEPEPEAVVAAPPTPGLTLRDPASGTDPKSGPVEAQTTVQEAGGRSDGSGRETEQAAKEEKGTPAAGDKAPAAPEKAAQQPAGGQAAPAPTDAGPTPAEAAPAPAESVPGPASAAPTAAPASAAPTAATPASASASPGSAAPASANRRSAAPEGAEPRAAEPAPRTEPGRSGGTAAAPVEQKKQSEPAPDLSTASPEAGLATAARLKPHRALEAMTGVGRASDRAVGDEHKNLATAPPAMQRPAGAPQTLSGDPKTDAPVQYSKDPAARSTTPENQKAEVAGAKEPEGQIEAEKAEEPSGWDTFKMALGFGIGKVAEWLGFEVDAQELAAKFAGLPTKDEALKQAMAGNAPGVQMTGAADQTSNEQGAAVDTKGQQTVGAARDDTGRGMGEDQVYPDVPPEQMEAQVPGREGGPPPPAGSAPTGVVPAEAASKVAEHDNGPRIQTAFQQGRQGMAQSRQDKDRGFRDSQATHRSRVDTEITINTKDQAGVRGDALADVESERATWRSEQDEELSKLGTKKTDRQAKVRSDVQDREKKADDDVTKEKGASDKKIRDEAANAERDAERERETAVQNSGNWVTKAFEWLKQKVIEIKNAIVRVIRAARDAVVGFIRNFKSAVERWINEARTFIVDAIKKLIDELIEFAKAMVQAIIDLANRIRTLITDLINAAIALVNKLATMLKQIIKDLLDALGKLLKDLLKILLRALLDVIKAIVDAVKQVLAAASHLLGALGKFMFVAIDFLSDPGGWLGGAKNSAVDGAKNHLFREVKSAVKAWFQSKIEEVLGIGKAVFDTLVKGGLTLEKIVKETWDAIVPMLPIIIGEIVITKVIAKLIPGAGWVMAVIDAIRTAIGAMGEILRAFGAVLTWLMSVRQGGAGILFAKAVAAGIVALLELAYEALISGVGKYVAKVGKRLKAVAQRMLKGKKRGTPGESPRDDDGPDRTGERAGETTTGRPDTATPPAVPRSGFPGRPGTIPRPRPPAGPRPDGRPPAGPRPDGRPPAGPGTRAASVPGRPSGDRDTPPPARRPASVPPRPTPAATAKPSVPAGSKDRSGKPGTSTDQKTGTRPASSAAPTPVPGSTPDRARPRQDERAAADARPKPDGGTPKTDGGAPRADRGVSDKPPSTRHDDPDKTARDPDGGRPRPDRDKPSKPERDGDGRPSTRDKRTRREDQRDQRRREEDSPAAKSKRLALIVPKIRKIIKQRTEHGMQDRLFRAMLVRLRMYYRLKVLVGLGQPITMVHAGLSPLVPVEDVNQVPNSVNGTVEDWDDPQDVDELPPPDSLPFVDNELPRSFYIRFINPKFAKDKGRYPPSNRHSSRGMRYIIANDLQNPDSGDTWDLMHLLPRQLGGNAAGTNFIPARNSINKGFYHSFEKFPVPEFGHDPRFTPPHPPFPGWYRIGLQLRSGPARGYPGDRWPEGFPQGLVAAWGVYHRKGRENPRLRSSWAPEQRDSAALTFPPPPQVRGPVNLSTEKDRKKIGNAIKRKDGTRRRDALITALISCQPYVGADPFEDMRVKLTAYTSTGAKLRGLNAILADLEVRYKDRLFTF
ncbi:DUF4157 domain-containing protein [Actinoplanes hulinensis]|uniref:DUF4157 domain-containing protein n=1 Tax=Actinoplanes hulinensis TaxID=1144547 RepID=A0ABS7B2J5_9ACTN|nr:DUF4157 domain-containing protein [Actinoplanes hulinensis]MBW6435157.1 DUF4157 domain-containing protein [Actinoplanes hulinensis]